MTLKNELGGMKTELNNFDASYPMDQIMLQLLKDKLKDIKISN